MTKKRLTDMLREEMQKSPEKVVDATSEATPPIEVNAELIEDSHSNIEILEVNAELVKDSHAEGASKSRQSGHTKAELEILVNELKQAAQQKETELLQQIATLQAEVQEQKQHVSNLRDYLEQANQLKSELDQVKQNNIQLTEANQLLTEEVSHLKQTQPKATLSKTVSKPEIKPASEFKRPFSVAIRPIESNDRLSGISNDNIGWFD